MTKEGGSTDKAGQPVPAIPSAGFTVSLDEIRAAAAAARASTQDAPASGSDAPGKAAGEAGGTDQDAGGTDGKPEGAAAADAATPTPDATPAGGSEPEPDGADDPDLDHADRTRLGRNLAKLRNENQEIKGELKATRELLEKLVTASPAKETPAGEPTLPEIGDDDAVMTVGDVRKLLAAEDAKRTAVMNAARSERLKYSRDFVAQFGAEEFKSDPLMPKIQVLIMENIQAAKPEFNTRYTGDPQADFRTNFLAAKAAVLSGASIPSTPVPGKTPTKGEKPNAALGVGGDNGSRSAGKASAPIAVDPIGKSFLRYLSEKGEDAEALATRAFAVDPRSDLTRGTGRPGATR